MVDEVAKEGGPGMEVTLVVKAGDEYIRVATSVLNPTEAGEQLDGSGGLKARLDKKQANPTMAKSRFLARRILLRARSSVSTRRLQEACRD